MEVQDRGVSVSGQEEVVRKKREDDKMIRKVAFAVRKSRSGQK